MILGSVLWWACLAAAASVLVVVAGMGRWGVYVGSLFAEERFWHGTFLILLRSSQQHAPLANPGCSLGKSVPRFYIWKSVYFHVRVPAASVSTVFPPFLGTTC